MPAATQLAAGAAGHKAEHVRTVGVLALQGAFAEHEAAFEALPEATRRRICVSQVRTPEELDRCDALVIPGGESTAMKIIAGCGDMMERLKAFVRGGPTGIGHRGPRPVWGTCAGCILLSDDVDGGWHAPQGVEKDVAAPPPKRCKFGGSIGGLDVSTQRNFFGRQAESFEVPLLAVGAGPEPEAAAEDVAAAAAFSGFPAVFIRAPGILKVGPGVRVLARVQHPTSEIPEGVAVAVESSSVLVTCFHPELSEDPRIHGYFVERFVLGSSQPAL